MYTYRVLGGLFHSELEFPELAPAPAGGTGSWVLSVSRGAPPPVELQALGSDEVRGAGDVRLFRHDAGFRLSYPDTGTYDLTDRGSRIIWFPPAERTYDDDRFVEAVQIGRAHV